MSLAVSYSCCIGCLSLSLRSHGVAVCLSLSPMVAALAVYNCLSGPMELLHVSYYLLWLLAVSHCLSQCHRVATCLSLCLIVAGCLSLSLRSLWSCWLSLTVSDCCWLSAFENNLLAKPF